MGGANGALFPVHRPSESHADMCNFQFFPYLCDNVPDVVADPRRCFSRVDRFPPPAKYFPFPAIDDELKLGASDFAGRSEEHTSELPSLMRHSYAVFCLK